MAKPTLRNSSKLTNKSIKTHQKMKNAKFFVLSGGDTIVKSKSKLICVGQGDFIVIGVFFF